MTQTMGYAAKTRLPLGLQVDTSHPPPLQIPPLFSRHGALQHSLGLSDRSSDSLQGSGSHPSSPGGGFGRSLIHNSFMHSPLGFTSNSSGLGSGSGSVSGSLSPSLFGPRTTLPAWALDSKGHTIVAPLSEILMREQLTAFAMDKTGCHYLQENYPALRSPERVAMIRQVLMQPSTFDALCSDVFANFFVQCVIAQATRDQNYKEQELIVENLKRDLSAKAINRYTCRVLQKAVECLHQDLTNSLLTELAKTDLVPLCLDQNANHVIQKMVLVFPPASWCQLIESLLAEPKAIIEVAENKYGCRVVQLFIEQLCEKNKEVVCARMLQRLMEVVMANCERMASNEFANYVVQHIVKTGPLSDYRNAIIDNCLLRNLLSMSQEKYASHVVEAALENAPPPLLKDMMDEIFDGYIPHPETKKDALDILMFHQYGNYVVQRMLNICCQAYRANLSGIKLPDMGLRMEWLRRLQRRIHENSPRLSRYSSGKKIIDTLKALLTAPASATTSAISMASSFSPPTSSYVPTTSPPASFIMPYFNQGTSSYSSLSSSPPSNSTSLSAGTSSTLQSHPFLQLPLPSLHSLHAQSHAHSVGSGFHTAVTATTSANSHRSTHQQLSIY